MPRVVERTSGAMGTRSRKPSLLPGVAFISRGRSIAGAFGLASSAVSGRALLGAPPPSPVADPRSHAEAMLADREGWIAAEKKELANHEKNESYVEMDRSELPRGRKLVKTVWAYKTKRNGSLKARLCVQGCAQVPGVDYHQTFCAAMRISSLRLLAATAANLALSMRRWDFVSAYLQGDLEPGEVCYCYAPPCEPDDRRYGADGKVRILRVIKPIYGMAQAGRRWQRSLFPWMLDPAQGFTQSESDSCVFIKKLKVSTPTGDRDGRTTYGFTHPVRGTCAGHAPGARRAGGMDARSSTLGKRSTITSCA